MARAIPTDRFSRLIEVATNTFITRGYRRTQMADVAQALGVAKGTLYGYVESKDALFGAAVRFADRRLELPTAEALPIKTPARGETVSYVRERLTAEASEMVLAGVTAGVLTFDDAEEELRAILGDLYERLSSNRFAIKLIDRCTDYPELADAWFGRGRWAQHEMLVRLIRRRVADGTYRALDDVEVVARTLLETITFWAVHRHFDPAPQQVDDARARRTVVELLTRGLFP